MRKRGRVNEIAALTVQFVLTLRATVLRVKQGLAPGFESPTLARVEELLEVGTWEACYEVEQQLVSLFEPDILEAEYARRLVEAKGALSPELLAHYDRADFPNLDVEHRRELLGRLVNDLQWRYTVREVARQFMRDTTAKTSWIMFTCGVAFLATCVAHPFSQSLLIVSGAAGAWGASFSVLSSLRRRLEHSTLDELKLAREVALTISRVTIGAAAGIILYYFIRSGLLLGKAFPDLNVVDAGNGTFAHLVVWTFLAGFSEKLIPNLLARTEGKTQTLKDAKLPLGQTGGRSVPAVEASPADRTAPRASVRAPKGGSDVVADHGGGTKARRAPP